MLTVPIDDILLHCLVNDIRMFLSTESAWDQVKSELSRKYERAIVYADAEQERVLHEGELRLLVNGWVELPTGRLLSPDVIHHIDTE